jgi:hypothetical protein
MLPTASSHHWLAMRADGWRWKMANSLASDDRSRDLTHGDAYRWSPVTRSDRPGHDRFGRTRAKRIRIQVRAAFRRANDYFRKMIEAIADSKMRRMERELALRGIRFDSSKNDWVTPDFQRPSLRKN